MKITLPQRSPRTQREATDPLTASIIASAIEVHRILGPGLLESIYDEALSHELRIQAIPFERQKEVDVFYKDKVIKGQRLDLVVDNQVVIEIKAVKTLNDVFSSQVLSYLKSTGLRRGLLINFNAPTLVSGLKRFSL